MVLLRLGRAGARFLFRRVVPRAERRGFGFLSRRRAAKLGEAKLFRRAAPKPVRPRAGGGGSPPPRAPKSPKAGRTFGTRVGVGAGVAGAGIGGGLYLGGKGLEAFSGSASDATEKGGDAFVDLSENLLAGAANLALPLLGLALAFAFLGGGRAGSKPKKRSKA